MTERISRPRCFLTSSLVFLSTVALANEQAAGTTPVPVVKVSGQTSGDVRESATSALISLTRAEISKFGNSSTADVLRRLPGVSVDAGRGGEVRMRGLGNGYTQILVNGERTPPGFSLDSIAPELIERIEVNRSASADTGAQGIAGSINIVLAARATPKPQRKLDLSWADQSGQPTPAITGRLSGSNGQRSHSITGTATSERRMRPASILEIGTDASGEQDLLRTTTRRNKSRRDLVSVAPQLKWVMGQDSRIAWDSFVSETRLRGTNFDDTLTLAGPAPQYASNDLYFEQGITVAQSSINLVRPLDNDVQLTGKLGVNFLGRTSDVQFVGFDNSGSQTLDRSSDLVSKDIALPFSGKLSFKYAERHSLSVGWDGEYRRRDEERVQRDITPPGLRRYDIDESHVSRVGRLALFMQDDWQIRPHLSAYAGVRWEGLQTDTTGTGLGSDGVKVSSSVFSPMLHTMWKPFAQRRDQVRFSLARTYRAPTTVDLLPRRIMANNNSETSPDQQGNPALRPELATGVDLAYERFWDKGGMFSVNVFNRDIAHVVVNELTRIGRDWVLVPVNRDKARTYGVEVELKSSLAAVFGKRADPTIRMNVARNWSTVDGVDGPDNRLSRQEPFSANIGFDSALPGKPVMFGANFGFQRGGRAQITRVQSESLPKQRTLDSYVTWTLNPKVKLRLTLSNILRPVSVAETAYADNGESLRQITSTPSFRVVRFNLELND